MPGWISTFWDQTFRTYAIFIPKWCQGRTWSTAGFFAFPWSGSWIITAKCKSLLCFHPHRTPGEILGCNGTNIFYLLQVIPDSVSTISQYINFMRDSFRREGFNGNGLTVLSTCDCIHFVVCSVKIYPQFSSFAAQTVGNIDPGTAGSAHVGGTQSQESQPGSTSAHHVLPTAALLAETMHSTRQLLVDLAGELLSVSCIFQSLLGFK